MKVLNITFLAIVYCLATCFSVAEDWSQWRGPDGSSIVEDGQFPTEFSNEKNVVWKFALEGKGTSTPATWGKRIFVTCKLDGEDGVVCLNWKGKEKWSMKLGVGRDGKKRAGGGCNPSPVVDGKRVYVYYKSGTVAALDLKGKVIWKKNLQKLYGEDTLWWDLGTSPVLAGGNIVIAVMQAGNSYIVAMDAESGKLVWKVDRNFLNNTESDQAYTTPHVIQDDSGKDLVITYGADHLTAHQASDGKLLWTCGGFNPLNKGMWRVIASAAISDGIAFVPYGRKDFLAGVRLGGKGDITESNKLWTRKGKGLGTDSPSPLAFDEKALLLTDRGGLRCFDLKTGEDIWEGTLPRAKANYYSSPVMVGRRLLYCAREDGTIFVVKLNGNGMEVVSENSINEKMIALVVPVNDRLLIRGGKHLYCIGD